LVKSPSARGDSFSDAFSNAARCARGLSSNSAVPISVLNSRFRTRSEIPSRQHTCPLFSPSCSAQRS